MREKLTVYIPTHQAWHFRQIVQDIPRIQIEFEALVPDEWVEERLPTPELNQLPQDAD